MKTTELFKCRIRNRLVALTPEEKVRQRLVSQMIDELGFPKGLISVEKAIGPRRFDIVCYTKEMTPLLLIECKAEMLNEKALRQVFGYNEMIRAPFLSLAWGSEVKTIWKEKEDFASVPFLPKFQELYEISKRF
jgi:hypothetical protein